jgi:membrane-bound lytic murein transglycosylase D
MFGSWYLAAAAYNSGSGRIARLLKEYGHTKGPDELFWEIQDELPQETRGYVPALIAAAVVGEYPQLFGLSHVVPDVPVRFETVSVPGATELRAVARASGTSLDEIRELNPHYHRGITPPDRHSEVRVPIGASGGFQTALGKIPPEERTRQLTRTHIVRQGETLSGIAARYGTTVAALQKANRITRPHVVSTGRKLVVPSGTSTGVYGTD